MPKATDEIDIADRDTEDEDSTAPEGDLDTTPVDEASNEEEEVFTFKKSELEQRINAEKANLGRELKIALSTNQALKQQFDTMNLRVKDMETHLTAARERERDAELKAASGDSDLIDAIKLKHQNEDMRAELARERSEIAREKAQHQSDVDTALKFHAENKAKELAKASSLSVAILLSAGSDTVDGRTVYNIDRMERLASAAPKNDNDDDEDEDEEDKPKNTRANRGMAARVAAGGRRRGLNSYEDYEKAYGEGRVSIEEFKKAAERFKEV